MPIKKYDTATIELVIFHVGDLVCALESIEVQELIKVQPITQVHQSDDYVKGVINLRGNIVSVLDLQKKFGFGDTEINTQTRIIIVKNGDENIGLVVDRIDDILIAKTEKIEASSGNISDVKNSYFNSIYKMDEVLVSILNLNEILNSKEDNE